MGIDLIGSGKKFVAVFDTAKGTTKSDKEIVEEILKHNPNIKSILKKTRGVFGKYRMKRYKLIWGDKNTEIIHKEHGYILKLDPRKVYFSIRESTERQRISKEVEPNEDILVMFSGVSSFPIAIAKMQPKVNKIIAIEINPEAHKYALENVRINKLSHKIIPIKGNVKNIIPKLDMKFNRILLPLPLEAYKFLEMVVKDLKDKGIIHLYFIGKKHNSFSQMEDLVKMKITKLRRKIKILNKRLVLQYSPRKWKCVLDIYVF